MADEEILLGGPGSERHLAPDLLWILGALRRRWFLVVALTALATVVSAWWASRAPRVYRANAVIRLADNRQAMAGRMGASPVGALQGRTVDPLLSLAQVLTSRRVAGVVVDSIPDLRVTYNPLPDDVLHSLRVDSTRSVDSIHLRFGPDSVTGRVGSGSATAGYGQPLQLPGVELVIASPPAMAGAVLVPRDREAAIDDFTGNIRVDPREDTDVADVYYYNRHPSLAQEVVNRAVLTFQQVNTQTARLESTLRREFLEEQLRENNIQLLEAQQRLSGFRASAQVYSSRERLGAEQNALASMSVREQELQDNLGLYRSALDRLQRGEDVNFSGLLGTPGVAENPVLRNQYGRLEALQSARDTLTAGPFGRTGTNPDVRRIDTLLAQARGDLTQTMGNMIASGEARLQGIRELKDRNAQAFRQLSGQEVTEAQLALQVEGLMALANQLREEYQRARIAEAVEVGQVEIVDLAVVPDAPIGVNPRRKMLFGFLLGLCASMGLALLLEHLNTSIRRRGQLQHSLQIPELGIVPQVNGTGLLGGRLPVPRLRAPARRGRPAEPTALPLVALDLQSGGAEAYRLIRTNLLFLGGDRPLRSLMVTSAAPGDGKTTVSTNLAATFAKQGLRVLLIDCDLRRGRLHGVFGLPRRPGLAEVLEDRATLADVTHQTPVENLAVITMGTPPATPAELEGGATMRGVVESAQEAFDLVILDSPPVLSTADASILGTLTEAVVLVVRAGKTDRSEAQAAVGQLEAVGANVVGAILNDQDATVESREHYYYASYYGPPKA